MALKSDLSRVVTVILITV